MTRRLLITASALLTIFVQVGAFIKSPHRGAGVSELRTRTLGTAPFGSAIATAGRGLLWRVWLATALGAFLLAAVLVPSHVQAQQPNPSPSLPPVLIASNDGQTSASAGNLLKDYAYAQAFTTGSQGYLLSSIKVDFAAGGTGGNDQVVGRLHSATSDGRPGDSLGSLSIITPPKTGANKFVPINASRQSRWSQMILAPNTTYFFFVSAGSSTSTASVALTDSNDEDSGGVSGSSIADGGYKRAKYSSSWTASESAMKIKVYGQKYLTVSDAVAREGFIGAAGDLNFKVTVSPPIASGESLTVRYVTQGITATAEKDFDWKSGTLTFSSGQSSKTVAVNTLDDRVEDDGETMELVISSIDFQAPDSNNVTKHHLLSKVKNGIGTIRNTELPPPPDASVLSEADAEQTEGVGATMDFVVTLDPAETVRVTVDYRTTNLGDDYTATSGSDYTSTNGTLTFKPGETTKTVSVPISADDEEDDGETFLLYLRNPVNAQNGGGGVGTIRDPSVNTPATSAPTINGTPQVEQTLTADTSSIADEDGLTSVSYEYQWLAGGTDIAGATSSSYTLTSSEQGKTIQVQVTFTDDADNQEILTSEATVAVAAKPNTAPTGLPTINGKRQVGQTLTADTSNIADEDGLTNVSYEYQWIAGGTDIDGANGSSYTLTASEQGQTIQVRVTFTDDSDNQETLTSAATVAIMPQAGDAEPMAPIWSADMLVVEYTSVSIGAASADLFSNIGGSGDLQIKSLWSYTLDRDLRLAFQEGVPGAANLTLQVGDLSLEFPAGSSGESSFKWTEVDVDWEDGETIPVSIVQTSTLEEPEEQEEPTDNAPATGEPTISGTAQVDETLTAETSNIADEDGLDDVSYSYQWIRSDNGADTDIAGETDFTYTLVLADLGKTIKVKVTFTDDAENEETLTSVATVPVAAAPNREATGDPAISGTPQVDQTLTASTSAIADQDGLDGVSYNYQWIADDTDIQDATDSSYTPSVSDVGKIIKVKVSFTDDRNNAESRTSVATTAVLATLPTQPLSLTVEAGEETRELDASWQAPSSNGGSNVTGYKVQWKEAADSWDTAADVSEATVTGTTHTITGLTGGVEYAVRVIATNGVGDGPASAEAKGTPAAENNAPTGLPTINGTPQVEQTLTAGTSGINDADGLTKVSYEYQWIAGGTDIPGATGSTYELTGSEQGQTIQVRVSFTDDADNQETLTSEATVAVAAKANTAPTGQPTISGTPQVEQTLTADTSSIGDADGLTNVSYEYQWIAGGSDIDGATGSSYTLTYSEQGKTIQVRVTFTDDADNEETLTSEATVAVASKPTPLTATISNVPASHSGSSTTFTFDLAFSENFPLSYITLRDHAFSEDDDGPVTRAQRKVQGSNQTWTITVKPKGNGAITVTLPETTDCNAAGAICTDDGRKLSNSTTVTVAGPE